MGAVSRGLSLQDFDNMEIGEIVDFCITYNNLNYGDDDEKETIREGTAVDAQIWL